MNKHKEIPSIDKVDLRSITRYRKQCVTAVYLEFDWETKVEWIVAGQSSLHSLNDRRDGRWTLDARTDFNLTDVDHSACYALRLPLIGVDFGSFAVQYHSTHINAWVDPNKADWFHVPKTDYDPRKVKGGYMCTVCTPKHRVVAEGCWLPPFNEELYQKVAGRRVEILIAPVFPGDS